jgi:hypothetical protein
LDDLVLVALVAFGQLQSHRELREVARQHGR